MKIDITAPKSVKYYSARPIECRIENLQADIAKFNDMSDLTTCRIDRVYSYMRSSKGRRSPKDSNCDTSEGNNEYARKES